MHKLRRYLGDRVGTRVWELENLRGSSSCRRKISTLERDIATLERDIATLKRVERQVKLLFLLLLLLFLLLLAFGLHSEGTAFLKKKKF